MQTTMLALFERPLGGAEMAGQMNGMLRGGHGGGFFLGGLMSLLWTVLIVLAVLWVVRNWASIKTSLTGLANRAASTVQASNAAASVTQT
ncbi:MAG: hypothetical protein M3Q45_00035, partial [Chloroflexota bacterium]|nr:hypothetical protein [Chloroflexota bacterium]